VLARITTATEPAADRQVKDLTGVIDKVMTATGDLDKALSSLALFTDLWPKAIPGDYLQLDVVLSLTNTGPPGSTAAAAGSSSRATSVPAAPPPSLERLLWGAAR
jgi:hypothetical protein